MENRVLSEDLQSIYEGLSRKEREKFVGATVLITGCAGFLGFSFLHFFCRYAEELKLKSLIGTDNFMLGTPNWIERLCADHKGFLDVQQSDIIRDDISGVRGADEADFIIHMASIASPVYYRQYPIETLDANIWGLRGLLDYYRDKSIRGFLFFSSSEIYGDPVPESIPTDEEYRGNVSPIGPRACYDEAKRFGETICYLFSNKYQMPIGVARPFNNYGPGMSLDDKRVPADFAKAVLSGENIEIFSDGSPTRTFCYVADAITGYLKVLCHGQFDYFNIGVDKPEISIRELANIYVGTARELFGYQGEAIFAQHQDGEYLTHNPNRRCPDLTKARSVLSYRPEIRVEDGVKRFLDFHCLEKGLR